MRIKLNSSNGLVVPSEPGRRSTLVRERLARLGELVTRVELHYHPGVPGDNTGRDLTCGLELRLAGKRPLKVHHAGAGFEAVTARALDKMLTKAERRVARKSTTSRKGHVRVAGGAEPATAA